MNEPSRREPIEEIAEEFLSRLRRGEHPSLTEYAERYPDLAARIRDLFPTLVMMERFGDPEVSAPAPPNELAAGGATLGQLGEYRILREIGRGGMGVVYEAEQESLGRHVALKVLASHWRLDEKQLRRFHREARAVARLHHPSIVPIHASGEHQGIPYYVMQYIRGQGLDGVLEELRALAVDRQESAQSLDALPLHASEAVRTLVRGLDERRPARAAAGVAVGAALPSTDSHDSPAVASTRIVAMDASLAAPHSSVAALAGQAESGGRSSSAIYFQSVARMGAQVADALAYAHEQGILHRDIKPSNLLLDESGAVWITDFGLAKTTTAEDNLTDTGDMVGTLRYVAPEQLRGWADPRSDVYGLGLTLYELLSFRPAFLERDRARLLMQVLHENPPRLRKLCRNVPLDLETIVHKAMAKEPEQRYATASGLAEDLRRFMEGKPIQARRTTLAKRAWLWSRRNPLLAALLAFLLVFLPAALATVTAFWRAAELEREAVTLANNENRLLLREAYLSEARALGSSRRPETRQQALSVLAKAAAIRPTLELRNEAIAAMVRPDLRRVRHWRPSLEPYVLVCLDHALARCAYVEGTSLRVRSTADDDLLLDRALDGEVFARANSILVVAFLPGDEALLLQVNRSDGLTLVAWDMRTWRAFWASPRLTFPGYAFDRGGRYLAIRTKPQMIEVHDLRRLELVATVANEVPLERMAFHPTAPLLAVSTQDGEVYVHDWLTGGRVARAGQTQGVMDLDWSPNGELLVAGGTDYRALVWRFDGGEVMTLRAVLTAHQAEVTRVEFSQDGRYLATSSWDGNAILWDARRFREIVTLPGAIVGLDGVGRVIATQTYVDGSYHLWEIEPPFGMRRLQGHLPDGKGPKQVTLNAAGDLLASASTDGIRLWNFPSGTLAHFLPTSGSLSVGFAPDGRHLFTAGRDGFRLWPLAWEEPGDGGERRLVVGEPQHLAPPALYTRVAMDAAGKTLAASEWVGQRVRLFPDGRDGRSLLLTGHASVREVAVSPDGKWLATATWQGRGVRLWDAQTGEFLRDVDPQAGTAHVAFSPDGRWFASGTGAEYRFLEVDGWAPRRTVRRNQSGNLPGPIAFSADGRMLAIAPTIHAIQLLHPDSGEEIATFAPHDPEILSWLTFADDGAYLIAGTESQTIQVWDLRSINEALAAMGLNWQ